MFWSSGQPVRQSKQCKIKKLLWSTNLCQHWHVLQFTQQLFNSGILFIQLKFTFTFIPDPVNMPLGFKIFVFGADLGRPSNSNVPSFLFPRLWVTLSCQPAKWTFPLSYFQSNGHKNDSSVGSYPRSRSPLKPKCFLVLILPVHSQIQTITLWKSLIRVYPGPTFLLRKGLLRLGLAPLTSQQLKYGKVFILLLLQPWPF